MLTDNEIRRITEDSLWFTAFAKTLEEIITTSETPIVIGIYGAWGSGKTSLMRMTQDLLEKGNKNKKTVWFEAWKFDETYDLRVALIHAILRRMKEDEGASKRLKKKVGKLLKRVNWLGLGKTALSYFLPPLAISQGKEPLLKNKKEITGKTLELIGDFEEEFERLTREYVGDKGRMVVFIDDLDRCVSEKTIDILEAIKLFLNVPLSVFVIGADKERIEEGIIEKYGEKAEVWAENYLEKIVQIPFTLPPLRKDVPEQFIKSLDVSTEIKKYAPILAEVGDNPRTIKRLLNSFELKRILAEKKELKVEKNIMAKLAVIDFRWHDFYIDLIGRYSATKTNLAQILKETSESNEAEREKKLKEWKSLRKYFEEMGLMDFLKQKPSLGDVNLDDYIYLARSTMELPYISALISALKDKDTDVRNKAEGTLVERGHEAVEPLIGALKDEHPRMRECAARALGRIGADRARDALEEVSNNDNFPVVRSIAKDALKNIKPNKNQISGKGGA